MSGRANSKALCHGMHVLERASLQPSNPPANKDEEVESSLSAQSLQHLCCTLLVRLEKRKGNIVSIPKSYYKVSLSL
jgi:hypothetical protein